MKVSVIIPMYNAESTIEKCLESVLNQTYKGKIEVLIINDGSKDSSKQIVESFIHNNSALDIQLFNKENGGVSSARNVGLKLAKGDFIALLDSDDEWLPEKVEMQINYLRNKGFDFICSCRNNEVIGFPYKIINNEYAEISLRKLLIKVVGQTSTAIFKKEVLLNTGYFDENQRYSEDANFWMKISLKNKMIILNKSLVITGGGKPAVGFSGLSADLQKMEEGAQKNISEMYDLGNLSFFEFQLIRLFSKIKYYIRIFKYKKNR